MIFQSLFTQRVLLISILGLLVVGGLIGGYYILNNPNEEKATQQQETRTQNEGSENELGNYNFSSFSDFLNAYRQETNGTEKQRIISIFLEKQSRKGFPVTNMTHATFIYVGGNEKSTIYVAGDFNGWNPSNDDLLQVLEGSTLYYRTYKFESDARLDYKFIVNGQWVLDPLNNRTCTGGFGPNSELAMPSYIDPPEIREYAIPHGSIVKHENVYAPMLSNYRDVYVYLPPMYNESRVYPTVYFHDGTEYLDLANATNTLDYLIYHGKIQPLIGVLIPPVNRNDEYGANSDYASFINDIVVPLIDSTYSTNTSSQSRAMIGVSLGGLISAYIAYNKPTLWGHVGSFSGAFWYSPGIIDQVRNGGVQDISWYIDYGTYEPSSISDYNNDLISILGSKGYEYVFYTWHEGHSWGSWRAHLDLALMYFFPVI